MKAVATALVLIAGAAVVLWYGNTLNSWVLGGLIGGLAALLLSIPISLTLFSYLSRRHKTEVQEEEATLAQVYDFPAVPRVTRRTYEVESYALHPEELLDDKDEFYQDEYRQERSRRPYKADAARNLPVPTSRRLSTQSQSSHRLPTAQRGLYAPREPKSNVPLVQRKDAVGRPVTTRRLNYPGFPGYEPGSSYSKQRSAALRAARREAAQHLDDVEVLPTNFPRPLPPSQRTSQPLAERTERKHYSSRQLDPRAINQYQYRSRRTVDATPSQQETRRSLPPAGESTVHQSRAQRPDPQTDQLESNFLETGPMHFQDGRTARQSQQDAQSEVTTGNLTRPLVRRAPYMYESDAMRQKLNQQMDAPIVRRSSLFESMRYEDD